MISFPERTLGIGFPRAFNLFPFRDELDKFVALGGSLRSKDASMKHDIFVPYPHYCMSF